MKDYFEKLFVGRRGMDELSKALFWVALPLILLSFLTAGRISGIANFLFILGIFMLIYAFIRAFSRRLQVREMENRLYLNFIGRQKQKHLAWKNRRAQRRDFRFFKCPGCRTWLRVPRGKGKIHINCKCGYTLYRKT